MVLLDNLEHILRQWSSGIVHGSGSHCKWEGQVVAQTVGKVELGCGEGNIALRDAQDGFGIVLDTVGCIVLQVDTTLGETRTAGAIQLVGTIIFDLFGGLQHRRSFERPLLKVMIGRGLLLTILCQAHYYDVSQVLELWQDMPHLLPQACMRKQDTRTTVVEHIDIVIGAQRGVQRNGNGPYLDRSEEDRKSTRLNSSH